MDHYNYQAQWKKKSQLAAIKLAEEARRALSAVPRGEERETYSTDSSVDPTSNKAAATFTYSNEGVSFRHPDGSSVLQTELVAIMQVLTHATEKRGNVIIHRDSLSSL